MPAPPRPPNGRASFASFTPQFHSPSSMMCLAYCFGVLVPILVSTHSMTTVQCPSGYFLSRFSSAHDGNERFYKFGCSRFSPDIVSFDESCSTTEAASTENGDMYLSCGSDQYTVGVEVIEGVGHGGVDSWQLLCCHSDSIHLRAGDCIDTKFINDNRRASTFSSSAQIIRRWQAMQENGDRRWWLQLCPVDVQLKRPKNSSDIRARRQVPWEWSRGRFPALAESYNPYFMARLRQEDEHRWSLFQQQQQHKGGRVNSNSNRAFSGSHFVGNNLPITTTTTTVAPPVITTEAAPEAEMEASTITSTTTPAVAEVDMPKLAHRSRVHQFNEKARSRHYHPTSSASTPASASSSTTAVPAADKAIGALDYYDMYDDNFDKRKHTEGGLLKGVSEFLQNIQDGLTLAQAAFPRNPNADPNGGGGSNFRLKIAVTPPPSPPLASYPNNDKRSQQQPHVMFSTDEDSLQIGPFVQQLDEQRKRSGPMPRPPLHSGGTSTLAEPRRETNTIESMLQMLGLCQGRIEL